jgi:hypothetical protein
LTKEGDRVMDKVAELGQISLQIIESWWFKYEKAKKGFRCQECHSRILQTTCHVSIHIKEFEPAHTGPGRVVKINYPYCPKCDGKLDYAQACYHVEVFKREAILIDTITLPINPEKTEQVGSIAKNSIIVNIPEAGERV